MMYSADVLLYGRWAKPLLMLAIPSVLLAGVLFVLALRSEPKACHVDAEWTMTEDSETVLSRSWRFADLDYHWVASDGTEGVKVGRRVYELESDSSADTWTDGRRTKIGNYCDVRNDEATTRFKGYEFALVGQVDGLNHYRFGHGESTLEWELWIGDPSYLMRSRIAWEAADGVTQAEETRYSGHHELNVIDLDEIGWIADLR